MRLQAFEGIWELERSIEDVRAGRAGRFIGRARFTPSPEGLAYLEEGELSFDDGPGVAASRRYLWREAGSGVIDVLFEDGRFFHHIDTEEVMPAAEHACPPDRYRVRYDFRAWPRWRAEWRVTGPRKDYCMLSTYRPAGQGGGVAA